MEKSTEIKLVQKPVIKHELSKVGMAVKQRIDKLNIPNLIATSDTIQALKNMRATLNKEYKQYSDELKDALDPITSEVAEIKLVFKTNLTEEYKGADSLLKDKIGEFEVIAKDERKEKIQSYFAELCLDADIDFVKFSDVGITISLSPSLKSYKEKCAKFVEGIVNDIALIKTEEFEAEIMVEYKATLNASKAITAVRTRKAQQKQEEERIKLRETQRRTSLLVGMNMVSHSLTKSYNWVTDENIYIEQFDVENMSTDEFNKALVKLESDIKTSEDTIAKAKAPVVQETAQSETVTQQAQKPIAKPVAPLKAPEVVKPEVKEKVMQSKFVVTAKRSVLLELAQYMKDNGIIYKNID